MTSILTLIRDRLEISCPSAAAVELVEDMDILTAGAAPRSGTIFVAPYRETFGPNQRMTGGHLQVGDVEFLTAIVIRLDDDPRGATRVTKFETLKAEIEAALAGWVPLDESDPVALVGSQGGRFRPNASVYLQTWETTRFLTGTEE